MNVHSYDSYAKVYPECPREIPNEMLSEKHAATIHGQSLQRLDERGGMSPAELVLNITREFDTKKMKSDKEAIDILVHELEKYNNDLYKS